MDIKEFLPELRRMIQGPLQTVMADELFSSAIIFCKESQVLRETLDAGDVKKGDKLKIVSTDTTLTPWGTVAVYNKDGGLDLDVDYIQHERGEIVFLRDIDSVSVVSYFIPTVSTSIPDSLMAFTLAVCYGAASKLYLTPDRSWSNGDQSNYYRRLFTEEYRDAWRQQADQFSNFHNPKINNSYWI